jgi:hypothetical protein
MKEEEIKDGKGRLRPGCPNPVPAAAGGFLLRARYHTGINKKSGTVKKSWQWFRRLQPWPGAGTGSLASLKKGGGSRSWLKG